MSVGRRIAKRIARLHPNEVHGHMTIDRERGIVTVDSAAYAQTWADRSYRDALAMNATPSTLAGLFATRQP